MRASNRIQILLTNARVTVLLPTAFGQVILGHTHFHRVEYTWPARAYVLISSVFMSCPILCSAGQPEDEIVINGLLQESLRLVQSLQTSKK